MLRWNWLARSVVVAVTSLFLAACGQRADQAATASGELTVTASEWKFDPAAVKLEAGRPLKLVLRNAGKIEHDLRLAGLTAAGKEAHLLAQPGQTATLELTAEKPGTYEMACTLPGHKDAGMIGKVMVVPASAAQGR